MITVELHPKQNSGEAAFAMIDFKERELSLKLETIGYGNHLTTMYIVFHSPDDMDNLASALHQKAADARKYLQEHP